jgi:hypothetical protein
MAAKKTTTRKRAPAKKKTATRKPAAKKPTPKKPAPKLGPTAGNVPSHTRYSEDDMPERAKPEVPGQVAPRADGSGRRAGQASPGEREYKAQYEMVDAQTAMQRAIARQKGELPPIEGGLDESQEDMMADDFDPLGDPNPGPPNYNPEPGDPDLEAEERRMAELDERHSGASAPTPAPAVARQAPRAPLAPSLPAASTRVSLELQDGTMTMPAITVLPETYGVTILLPLKDDGVTFIPKPGSSVVITHGEHRWPCYFPGTHFVWEEMQCMGLVFVRADEEN